MFKKMLLVTICVAVFGMANGMMEYSRSPYQSQKFFKSTEIDTRDEEYPEWNHFNLLKEESIEEELSPRDITYEDMQKLESETKYPQKIDALERAFFGNDILYEDFVKLKTQRKSDLASMKSAFLRWLIVNHRGNNECAKSLTAMYKHKDLDMYWFWKNVAIVYRLPVGSL